MIVPSHALSDDDACDEVLEALWTADELGESLDPVHLHTELGGDPAVWRTALLHLSLGGHVADHEGRLALTATGTALARKLIRRHRLTEVLYTQLLGLEIEAADRAACRMEHELDDDDTDAVCTFLGHPRSCPHGREVPRGACCDRSDVVSLGRLAELPTGHSARVALLLPDDAGALTRLTDLGLFQGARLEVRQRHPSLVVAVDQTVFALDHETAERVLVRKDA